MKAFNKELTFKQFKDRVKKYVDSGKDLPLDVSNILSRTGVYYNKSTKRFNQISTVKYKTGLFKPKYKDFKINKGVLYNLNINDTNTFTLDRTHHAEHFPKGKGADYFFTYIKNFFKTMFNKGFFSSPWVVIVSFDGEISYINGEGGDPFNKLFIGRFIYPFFTGSINMCKFNIHDYVKITVTKLINITPEEIIQNFAQGVSHCVIQPIKNWAASKVDSCKSDSSKKKYKSIVNKCHNYADIYKEGIPQDDIQKICNDLNIDITVYMPLGIGTKHGSNLLSVNTQKSTYGLKHFKYVNTRIDHVDILQIDTNENVTISDNKQMIEILNNIRAEGRCVPYRKVNNDILRIHDINKTYRLTSEYNKVIEEFEKLNNMGYIYEGEGGTKTEKDAVEFVKMGTHFNCCIDINNTYIDNETYNCDNVRHIDMEKAYYNYLLNSYYDGFLHTISEFRVCAVPIDDAIVTAGFYMIYNVDLTKCEKVIRTMNFIENHGIYVSPEIKFFRDIGVKFEIIAGVWGTKKNITMTEDMKHKMGGVPHYSRWVGSQAPSDSNYMYTIFDFDDDNENIISNMAFKILKNGVSVKVVKNEYEKKISLKFKKQYLKTRRHITAYITAYQRIATVQQALLIEHDDIIRINVDGIYFQDNGKYKNMKMVSSFVDDHDRKGELAHIYISTEANAVESYISNGYTQENVEIVTARKDRYVKFHPVSLLIGPGGCGKTYRELNDLSHFNVVYLAHSKNLSSSKYTEFLNTVRYAAPYQHLTCGNIQLSNRIKFRCNLIFCDEASTYAKCDIIKLIEIADKMGVKIKFAGDIGFQIDPFTCSSSCEKRLSLFTHIENCEGINYRFRGDKEHDRCMKEIRTLMTNGEQVKHLVDFLLKNEYKVCCKEDVIKKHTINDMILSTRHKYIHSNEYKIKNQEKFKDIKCRSDILVKGWNEILPKYELKKFRINKNGKYHSNGQIIISNMQPDNSTESYAFTIHSIQGMSTDNKLFIDMRGLIDPKVLYTAVSRSKTRDNIYLVF